MVKARSETLTGWNYDHEIASAAGGWDFSLSNRTPPMNVAKYGDG
jgi:hypothetical protein